MKLCATTLGVALLLVACGGGGGENSSSSNGRGTTSSSLLSSALAGICAVPRQGIDPDTQKPYVDRAGTLDDEKRWVRSWIDETYLWFNEVPTDLVASAYPKPVAYFDDLKTPARTASGRPKDRFHFTFDTAAYRALSDNGESVGYGMELAFVSPSPPRDVRVAYMEPGSPAAAAGISRGMKLIGVDGVDLVNGAGSATINTINAGLSPASAGEFHSFSFQLLDGSTRSVTLTSANITETPVQNAKVIPTDRGRVGYLQFNDHTGSSESQLIAAFTDFARTGIVDLVLDMRYNGGGLLLVASELAYMVATPEATQGTTFERLQFNSKNPFGYTTRQSTVPFHSTAVGYSAPAGQPLPQLGLSRVTVLTGPDTCSASESVINALRGVGIDVNLIGDRTCGKPYAFFPQDNCGTTYFAIQMQGVNNVGFGDYGDGFAPSCAVSDDFSHALGDPQEALLKTALTGQCINQGASGSQKPDVGSRVPYLRRPAVRENRVIDFKR
ncbi:S41 family peptidase [Variovorax sp. J22R133]|uniref:S41 family peptidase n=1 Tax=Variovorax brevis TaxID=3053503 RepID=UPI002577F1C8|nr:S41 family peptidase [Variovorax sp. J22R133]MDM0111650.1 S41 family peptidase [Variovorax sp. J22R133]